MTYHRGAPYIKGMTDGKKTAPGGKGSSHKAQSDRLSRIEGQIRGIRKMIEEERYCNDILLQIRSVTNALAKVQENIFRRHLETCVHDSMTGNDEADRREKIEEVLELMSRFGRQ